MAATYNFVGSMINLISQAGIRYEGILHSIDTTESTVSLQKVKSYGTEDRDANKFIPPREEFYDYIIFRGTDIRDLHVSQTPESQTIQNDDPAIIQVQQQTANNAPQMSSSTTTSTGPKIPSFSHQSSVGVTGGLGNVFANPFNTNNSNLIHGPSQNFTVPPPPLNSLVSVGGGGGGALNTNVIAAPIAPSRPPPPQQMVPIRLLSPSPPAMFEGKESQRYSTNNNNNIGSSHVNRNGGNNNKDGGYYGARRKNDNNSSFGMGNVFRPRSDRGNNTNYGSAYGGRGARREYSDVVAHGSQGYQRQGQYNSRTGPNRGPLHGNRIAGGGGGPLNRGGFRGPRRDNTNLEDYKKDYDFESNNAKIEEELAKIVIKENVPIATDKDEVYPDEDGAEVALSNGEGVYYDKAKSFFDSISSEVVDRDMATKQVSVSRKDERKLNVETFGVTEGYRHHRNQHGYGASNRQYFNRGGNGFSRGWSNNTRRASYPHRSSNKVTAPPKAAPEAVPQP